MLLSELEFVKLPEYSGTDSPPYLRVEVRLADGLLVVDKNRNGTYDFWGPKDAAVEGIKTASHLQLDPLTAQAVLYHYLAENKSVDVTLGIPHKVTTMLR